MTDMIEIVAKRVWLESATFPGKEAYWDTMGSNDREVYFRLARAAIEALRTPTDAMVSAGIIERHDQPCPEAWNLATQNIWQAMIDAALIVQPGGLERGIPVYRTDGDT